MRRSTILLAALVFPASCGGEAAPASEVPAEASPVPLQPLPCAPSTLTAEPEAPSKKGDLILSSDNVSGDNLLVSGGLVYFTTLAECSDNQHAVWAMPTTGGEARLLWRGAPLGEGNGGGGLGRGLALRAGRVFWPAATDGQHVGLFSVGLDGTNPTRLDTDTAWNVGVATDGTNLYSASAHEIISVPMNGGPIRQLTRSAQEIQAIQLRDRTLYFSTGSTLASIDIETGASRTIASFTVAYDMPGIAFDVGADSIYVSTGDALVMMPLAGGPPVDVLRAGTGKLEQFAGWGFSAVVHGPQPNVGFAVLTQPRGPTAIPSPIVVFETNLPNSSEILAQHRWVFSLAFDGGHLFYATLGALGRIDLGQ